MIVFDVQGVPAPKGSMRAMVRRGRAVMFNDNAATRPWADEITLAARRCAPLEPFDVPVEVALHFRLPRLAGHLGRGKNQGELRPSAPVWQSTKPDIDKLTRNVLDALSKAKFWADDSRVAALIVTKIYCDAPGVTIHVGPIKLPAPSLGVSNQLSNQLQTET